MNLYDGYGLHIKKHHMDSVMRTTISQIAVESGVSVATVDRVLNHRPGVSQRTHDTVMKIAQRLGYFGPVSGVGSARVKMDFILPKGANSFMRSLSRQLVDVQGSRVDCDITVHQIDVYDLPGLSQLLLDMRGRTDAVGLVALDRPEIRESVNTLANTGVKIATLLTDIHGIRKVGYVGIDNRAAGRLAGHLLGKFLWKQQKHNVVLFAGSMAYRGHEEREMGFRSILTEEYPNITLSCTAEVGDDRDLAYEKTISLFKESQIAGIYSSGAGNQGIGRALQELGRQNDVIFIGHDLTEASRLMLINRTLDAVIDQNAKVQAREVVKMLKSAVSEIAEAEFLPSIQVIFRENIPNE
ncbi:LacI family DNA-binding transcriptional regulator [Hirschia baltica]|uniref:Transcriptional regulator, LacI family n=1 Tax=Hirschia baltica (strain ATCC 49814 / DSM 5838 / IFAM 1418) TaxID=582402 RepID=C6XPV0_HIRBI|nr:LacI family DNA-binding transcriptional regulator [Hirschia baltica]ACT60365.1 transcriptional regulator, LacI family [Hirschia baltica ATCC 49814]